MTESQKSKIADKSDKTEKNGRANESAVEDAILNEDFRIRMGEPLSYLDKGKIKAYRAIGGSRHSANLFALVCDKSMTPRFLLKNKYTNINNPNFCKLVQSGKAYLPSTKEEKFCFVYEDTIGYPYIKQSDVNDVALGWKPEIVLSNIIIPMITLLKDLRNKELTHGEIWPGNMFDGGSKAGQKIYLGECLSAPASSQLPSLYEPIERALADPMGRGPGDLLDDLYSFGASLAVMLRNEDPMKGISAERIIEYKIEKGSYAALLGKERLSGGILELLRGLLYDDSTQRWTIEDLESWLDGRRLSPKQAPKRVKASRPIMFRGKKYTRPEVLAKDLHLEPDEAARLIDSNEMDQWVDRAIEDKIVKNRLEQALQEIGGYERGGSFNNRACVAVAHALYNDCCVRFKNIHFMPQGFGKYLTSTYVQQGEIEPFVEVIKYNFIVSVIRETRTLEKGALIASFDNARTYIKQKAMNAGLERVLYIIDPEAPCLSPILDKHYVLSPRDMMNAFEDICARESKATILFDRHIIAYLSVKDRQNIDPYLSDISSGDPRKRILGQLKILATIQKRLGLGNFPAICRWVTSNFDPVLEYFHDSKKCEALKLQVEKLTRDGDLKGIAGLFDGSHLYENDLDTFRQAMVEYQKLRDEQRLIEKELSKGNAYGQNTGRQIASVISMIISLGIMIASVYMLFLRG